MSDTPKISVILGGGQPDATADLLRRARAEMDAYRQIAEINAARKIIDYEEYVKAGFTPEQALQLIK